LRSFSSAQTRLGQRADPHLQAGAVGHHASDDLADGRVVGVALADRQFEQGRGVLDDRIDLRHVQARAGAADPGHVAVDLDDRALGGPGNLAGIVVADPHAEVAVLVHRRHSADKAVDADLLCQEARRLVEVIRDVADDLAAVLRSSFDQPPLGGGDEHAEELDAAVQLVIEDRLARDQGRLEVVDPQALDVPAACPGRQCA
jgi:hypothetical protein